MLFSKFLGPMWLILSLIISCLNDALVKTYDTISPEQVIFLRFSLGAIVLIPLIIRKERNKQNKKWPLSTKYPIQHFTRGAILSLAMYFWTRGINTSPLALVTTISFTIPVFLVIFARILLKEKVSKKIYLSTCIGFLGIIIAFKPTQLSETIVMLFFLIAAALFALLDIVNKHLINKNEPTLLMLFYSNFFAAIFSILPTILSWQNPSWQEMLKFTLLGINSNVILYCILKAYSLSQISSLAPLRYLELLISMAVGYFFFGESISVNLLIGAVIIILSTLNLALNMKEK